MVGIYRSWYGVRWTNNFGEMNMSEYPEDYDDDSSDWAHQQDLLDQQQQEEDGHEESSSSSVRC